MTFLKEIKSPSDKRRLRPSDGVRPPPIEPPIEPLIEPPIEPPTGERDDRIRSLFFRAAKVHRVKVALTFLKDSLKGL